MHSVAPTLLADDASSIIWSIGPIVLGLIVVVVVGWFAVVHVRNWMKASEESGEAFTLDDLRRMHRAGEISEAEFQRAREAMIGAVRSKGSKEPPPRNPDLEVLRLRHLAAATSTQSTTRSARQSTTQFTNASPTAVPLKDTAKGATKGTPPQPSHPPAVAPAKPTIGPPIGPTIGPTRVAKVQDPPSSLPNNLNEEVAPRRDTVVRRPSVLGSEQLGREPSEKRRVDPPESPAQ